MAPAVDLAAFEPGVIRRQGKKKRLDGRRLRSATPSSLIRAGMKNARLAITGIRAIGRRIIQ